MQLITLSAEVQRIEYKVKAMEELVDSVDPIIQGVFASQLAIFGAGLVEKSVIEMLGEYGRHRGDGRLSRYVQKTVSQNNSLNCSKIEKIFGHFDPSWWERMQQVVTEPEKSAIDSLKTLRDQIAHGGQCGAGFSTVRGYYAYSKSFINKVSGIVLP